MTTDQLEFDVGFDRLYGLRLEELGDGLASGTVAVRNSLRQPAGLVHGGVYAAVAESLASNGTAVAVRAQGAIAVGMSNHTSFLRPVTGGTISARARARHRGRSTWVWDVEFADDRGRLCAVSRVTVAIRPRTR